MKNIKELGLELIELEDQVLLVDDKKLIINGYIQRGTEKPVINKPDFWFDFGVPYKNVIASTKPLEGLPLLVIEDEAMSNALNLIEESKIETESTKLILIGAYTTSYNKAKETYKFTEEDLRIALSEAFKASQEGCQITSDEIIQSLNKKELWVDVIDIGRTHYIKYDNNGCNDVTGINFHKYEWELKISEGKIKAIWK